MNEPKKIGTLGLLGGITGVVGGVWGLYELIMNSPQLIADTKTYFVFVVTTVGTLIAGGKVLIAKWLQLFKPFIEKMHSNEHEQ